MVACGSVVCTLPEKYNIEMEACLSSSVLLLCKALLGKNNNPLESVYLRRMFKRICYSLPRSYTVMCCVLTGNAEFVVLGSQSIDDCVLLCDALWLYDWLCPYCILKFLFHSPRFLSFSNKKEHSSRRLAIHKTVNLPHPDSKHKFSLSYPR